MKIGAAANQIRPDFAQPLAERVTGSLGKPGSDSYEVLKRAYEPFMQDGKVKLDALPEDAKRELARLQGAAEDFEAHFVKTLLASMRKTSLRSEDSEMTNLAKEQMDASLAESVAKGSGGMGIGKTVFVEMGDRVVRSVVGQAAVDASVEMMKDIKKN